MNRLRSFLSAWRLALSLQVVRFSFARKWDKDTQGRALTSFLGSATGKDLVAALEYRRTQLIASVCVSAPTGGREYAAGYAAGFNEFVALLQHLSAPLPPQPEDTNEHQPAGDADLVERLSP